MKYSKKKTYKKGKKTYKKSYGKKKSYKGGFLKLVRWSNLDTTNNCHVQINGDNTVPFNQSTAVFALNNVSGSGELQSLFDNYRITKVLYRWVITRDPTSDALAAALRGQYPRITWVHDFNDSVSITRTQMYQHSGMREVYFGDNFQRTKWYTLKPAIAMKAYESVTSDSFVSKWKQWIDTAEAATPHYGIKYTIDQNNTGMSVRLEAKICLECKGIS